MKSAISLALTFGLLAGCATSSTVPDWVSGIAAHYPASQYLIGRGDASSGEEARDRARADLAKVFEVQVVVESEDVQAFRMAANEAKYEGQSARRITTRSDRLLEGVEIAETWHDPEGRRYHALAVLPRLKAGTALRQEIAALDATTGLQLDRARATSDLLAKIGAAAAAVSAQSERVAYAKSLRVVDPTGTGDASAWNLDRLRADLGALLKRVKIAPRINANSSREFEPIVKGALAAAGFLAETNARADYVLEGSLSLDDLGQQDGWYWQRGVLEVRLIEEGTQRVRGTKRWPIKASALARDGAVQRALDATDGILKKELRATVIEFAASSG